MRPLTTLAVAASLFAGLSAAMPIDGINASNSLVSHAEVYVSLILAARFLYLGKYNAGPHVKSNNSNLRGE